MRPAAAKKYSLVLNSLKARFFDQLVLALVGFFFLSSTLCNQLKLWIQLVLKDNTQKKKKAPTEHNDNNSIPPRPKAPLALQKKNFSIA